MAAQFIAGHCPVDVGTFVTYSQSENQESKHAADYTKAFSRKRGTTCRSAAATSGARRFPASGSQIKRRWPADVP